MWCDKKFFLALQLWEKLEMICNVAARSLKFDAHFVVASKSEEIVSPRMADEARVESQSFVQFLTVCPIAHTFSALKIN